VRPTALLVLADLDVTADHPELIAGRRVVIVEDGPTLTHGGMAAGAGAVAAARFGASEVVDPRPYAVGALAEAFRAYPRLSQAIPALGYSPAQVRDLEATLQAVPADVVLDATPAGLARLIKLDRLVVDVRYEFRDRGDTLQRALDRFDAETIGQREPAAPPAVPSGPP
jgi:predicted GTPase